MSSGLIVFMVIALLAAAAGAAVVFRRRVASPGAATPPPSENAAERQDEKLNGADATRADLDQATIKLKGGDATGAIAFMRAAERRVAQENGADSPEHAAAVFHLGTIYLAAGDYKQAAQAMNSAVAVSFKDHRGKRDHLTYLMNLGQVLARSGELTAAEKVLRDALAARQAFYGKNHPGYAYGLKPLAEVLLMRGRAEDAVPLITRATTICARNQTPLTPEALAVQVIIFEAASRSTVATWAAIAALDPASRSVAFRSIASRVGVCRGGHMPFIMEELLNRLKPPPEGDAGLYWDVASAAIRAAQEEGDTAAWLRITSVLIQQATRDATDPGAREKLIDLWQSRAMALEQAEQIAEATDAHQKALQLATESGEARLLARANRNLGLFLAEQKLAGAEEHLRTAVDHARQPGAARELGVSLASHAIFIQHAGDLPRATPMLQEAVAVMQPTDAQFLYARNHLDAIEKQQSCGCGKMHEAIARTIADMIRQRLPADLIRDVNVKFKTPTGPDVEVQVARKPTPDELEQLSVVANQAVIDLKQAMLSKY